MTACNQVWVGDITYIGLERQFAICTRGESSAGHSRWDSPPVRVDLVSGKFPRLVFCERGHKSREETVIPLTPDFAEYMRKSPEADRYGKVFLAVTRAGRILSDIGQHAGIVVSEEGKFVSAHDLRRTFGTRWAAKLRPIAIKTIMQHKDIRTTLSYYVDQEADDVGAEICASVHGSVHDLVTAEPKKQKTTRKKPE